MTEDIQRPGKARLVDVAAAAGVSIATASRALSKPHMVKPELRQQVELAIQTLNYRPDRLARALSLGHNTTIGAIVPTLGIAVFANGVECLQNRLDELGYTLLLGNSQYDMRKELKHIRAFAENSVAGLILVAGHMSEESLTLIRSLDVPVVCTYMHESLYGFPAVGIDNRKVTTRLTEHLLSLGHRHFGIISNSVKPNARSSARRDGAIDAIKNSFSDKYKPTLVEVDEPSIENGRVAFQRILEIDPHVTAVICTTDALALGVLGECKARKIIVPTQMSVTGFDDMDFVAHTDPPLTSVKVPAKEISDQAVNMLMAMISGETVEMSKELDAEIMFRNSIAPPPR
jgi:LacI family transcriptional regulator